MTLRLIHTSDWQIGKVFRFVDNAMTRLFQATDGKVFTLTTMHLVADDDALVYRPCAYPRIPREVT